MICIVRAVLARIVQSIAALAADAEDEIRHMDEVDQRWIVAGGVAVVVLIALLLGSN